MKRALLRPKAMPQLTTNDTTVLRTTLFLALFGYASAGAGATVNWEGDSLIPLGLQPRSEAVLRMPENITKYWVEDNDTVSISLVDPRTFTIKPTTAATEQRLFMLAESRKIFIAKLSTSLDYFPYVEVIDKLAARASPSAPARATDATAQPVAPEALLVAMMKNQPLAGFGIAPSKREILHTEDFLITAQQVWTGPNLTGLIATVTRQGPLGREVKLQPNEIEVVIAEFGGPYTIVGADRWALTDATPETRMYFLFRKARS